MCYKSELNEYAFVDLLLHLLILIKLRAFQSDYFYSSGAGDNNLIAHTAAVEFM